MVLLFSPLTAGRPLQAYYRLVMRGAHSSVRTCCRTAGHHCMPANACTTTANLPAPATACTCLLLPAYHCKPAHHCQPACYCSPCGGWLARWLVSRLRGAPQEAEEDV